VKFHDGSDPMRMHNMYSIIYNELVFNLIRDRMGEGEAVVFARASFAGGQRFPVHWGGDCESTWEAMAEAMRGCLSLTLSGFAFASHDIGGFEGHPPPEIYQRWVAFGLFSSHSRLHGSSSYRVPWNYGEEAAKNMATLLEAKHSLMPYLYQLAIEATQTGHPLQRAMFLEFPEDQNTHHLDRQFMLGPSLLVAPVFVPQEEETDYYIPAGRWTNFWDHKRTVVGPTWIKERVGLDDVPVWVRAGTVLLRGPPNTRRPDYDYGKDLRVELFSLAEGETSATVPGGATVRADRKDGKVKVTIEGNANIDSVFVIGAGNTERVVKVDAGAKEVVCELS